MRNKWFKEQIAEFKTRSDSEVLEFVSRYWNITTEVKGVFTMVGTFHLIDGCTFIKHQPNLKTIS